MKYRKLGTSGLDTSEIALGCMSLKPDDPASIDIIRHAMESGINYFDTADLYQFGENEKLVAKALSTQRKEVLIGTKVGNRWHADKKGWEWEASKEYILKAIDASLARLQTDYIDLYQLHGGTVDDPIDEIIEAFEMLIDSGKIRAYGISSIRPNVIRQYAGKSNIASVMMQYSLLDRRPEEQCLDFLAEHGIGVLARGSLGKGLLVNKSAIPYLDFTEAEVATIQTEIAKYSKPGDYLTSLPLSFSLSSSAVSSAVVGASSLAQLDEIINGYQNPPEARALESAKSITPNSVYTQHR